MISYEITAITLACFSISVFAISCTIQYIIPRIRSVRNDTPTAV